MSMFAKAKAKGTTVAKKKDERLAIRFDASYFMSVKKMSRKDADEAARVFDQNLKELASINEQMDSLNSTKALIESEVRENGKDAYIDAYEREGVAPQNFHGVSASGEAQFMYIVQDRYISVKDERAEELREKYGEDAVAEETTFAFDNTLLNKYEAEISKALESLNIPQADKDRLIAATTKYTVAKGMINKLGKLDVPVEQSFNDIQPVTQIKDVKLVD